MPNEPMTLANRLRNPQWDGEPGAPRSLNVERTIKDMSDAAAMNANLAASLTEMVDIYWGKEGDGGPLPACIQRAKSLLEKTSH